LPLSLAAVPKDEATEECPAPESTEGEHHNHPETQVSPPQACAGPILSVTSELPGAPGMQNVTAEPAPANAEDTPREPTTNSGTIDGRGLTSDQPSTESTSESVTVGLAPNLWRVAFQRLSSSSQEKLSKSGLGDPDSKHRSYPEQIEALKEEVRKRQRDCEDKFIKVKIGGKHEISLRDYAAKIMGSLQAIGDFAVEYAPEEAKLPWVVIRAILTVCIPQP
jgi:hypothetical protein